MSRQPPTRPGWYERPEGAPRYWNGRSWCGVPPSPEVQAQQEVDGRAGPPGLTLAVLAHLSGLLTVIGTLALAVLLDPADRLSMDHAVEALNFQLTVVMAACAIGIGGFFTGGLDLVLLFPLGVAAIVLPVRAALAAFRFQSWRYPMVLRLVRT